MSVKHPVVHIEISAKDREAAGQFYHRLFGWQVEQMPEMNYASFETGEGPGGGFNPVGPETPAGTVTVYIGTDDIEGDLKCVEELGGTIVTPRMEIPGFGWFALFRDPTGNRLGLYTAVTM